MNWQSSMRTSREKGRAEGRSEGRAEGIASGELKKAQEVASALAEKGMPVEEIAKIVRMEEKVVQKWLLL